MLTIQYRMHPLIRSYPSKAFYENAITDGQNVTRRKLDKEMTILSEKLRRVSFFDLIKSSESIDTRSKYNRDEVNFTLALVQYLFMEVAKGRNRFSSTLGGKIGIVTPYKAQVVHLKNALGAWLRKIGSQFNEIEVNTVDAFQGREKDIIIFNCVRSNRLQTLQGSLGFLTDTRRLNVAITRPRHFLLVVGNSDTLKKSDYWHKLVKDCKQK